ncbi:hypothetical protein AJ79_06297 [Helicocarpus griseus UAMH5409]|uniref:Formin GTPase-binding domain-containing protein n=1 Tax=Helicocarpus griseus UAMH5409 TaxID=1447875 RepID=A0A2B7XEN3_9EURO|nr:hypothetical protein AJ79_06297 [Helicocarpus griseus UAMH5409]
MASRFQNSGIFVDDDSSQPKASGLRSIFPSKAHKRTHSAGDSLSNNESKNKHRSMPPPPPPFMLPHDHPHSNTQRPLSEISHNVDAPNSPRIRNKIPDGNSDTGLHKKTKSSVSLRSLIQDITTPSKTPSTEDTQRGKKPKKTKSSTSLSAIFKRSQRGREDDTSTKQKDKENMNPPHSPAAEISPIWAQFASQPQCDQEGSHYFPPRGRTLDEEISLYTPRGYSPNKQRNFHGYYLPSLTKRPDTKPRPKSDYISSSSSSIKDMIASVQRSGPSRDQQRYKGDDSRTANNVRRGSPTEYELERRRESVGKRGSRVMAAISVFNAKAKPNESQKPSEVQKSSDLQQSLDPKEIERAFEELLDSRNIPHNMRDKMRSLDTNIKADFIRKHHLDICTSTSSTSSQEKNTPNAFASDGNGSNTKGPRSQSRGRPFSISRGDVFSPKKNTNENVSPNKRPKSVDLSRPGSSKGLSSSSSMTGLAPQAQPDHTADPTDFVHYLREVQRPEIVEVGKLHKLRILLRNETVAWVDAFISHGGMDEVIELLYRILKVEWREEHEDALLHETLLCLKALCTTSLALRHLSSVEAVLFPTLLHMLFDEEKKGPSEFTTRGIVLSLLFTHLSSASPDNLVPRARTILSYLRDPTPPEEAQPLNFIANIYQPRPYRVWCKEVSNVTKEVFWIFLHHLNVVPVTKSTGEDSGSYLKRHFPPPRPPVPAAPYVGGVEWDATNYIASHLDLMNGLLAAMPSADERNALRTDLRASGFEKVMGASLRICKEKFYSSVHDSLRLWVAAAAEDGWDYQFVREGPPRGTSDSRSPTKATPGSPKKRAGIVSEEPPKLDLAGCVARKASGNDGGWL